jgi:hypothetical protein
MRNGRKHSAASSAGGLLGGLLGTAAIRKAMRLGNKLPEPLRMPEMKGDPGDYVVSRAEAIRGEPLPYEMHARAARASAWIYGLAWAGTLAAAAKRLKLYRPANALLAGAGLGVLTWAAGYLGWLPAAGLTRPVPREEPRRTAMGVAGHVLYGLLVALPLYAVERAWKAR